jgi:TonB family protein
MKILGTSLALAALLAPTLAQARCCCDDGRAHWREGSAYHAARVADFDHLAFVDGHLCANYPLSAARAHASGVTWLAVRVGGDGWVEDSYIGRSSGRADLDRAALSCVRGWRQMVYGWRKVRVTWHSSWES